MSHSIRTRILDAALGVVLGLLLASAGFAWHSLKPSLPALPGAPSAKVADIQMETKPCKQVQAKEPKAKKKLGLPPPVQQDEQAVVLTAVDVPRTDEPLIATSLLHLDTGLGEIFFTPQPRPWLAFDRRWTAGVFYVARDDAGGPVWRLDGRYEAFQIKFLHVGAQAQFDEDGRRSVGVGAWASGR